MTKNIIAMILSLLTAIAIVALTVITMYVFAYFIPIMLLTAAIYAAYLIKNEITSP